ncbi:DNA topology modulation protein [Bacillus sp. CECT 9360]|uniref:DNA topology modulation protein n=1 Tax=Bacillus sp. CECT 9360 TaxID=2845821 RepID=UPI001E4D9F5D|nr:DNA topology modulation protein [Bacillus sp. CECT 9360]CAH0344434.1 hypothetical protein BCI9360_00689 [Bacillus sp. CECT 9360]
MKKIMILGCPGAGKSTLAKRLSGILHIPAIHLDAHFWQPGWIEMPREKWQAKHEGLMAGDSWIMDGHYSTTIGNRFVNADTVIYLEFPTIVCLYRIIKRRFQYHGETRPDMASGCPEKIDWEFFSYVATFNRQKAPILKERIASLSGKKIMVLKNRRQIEAFLKQTNRFATSKE